MKKTILQLSYDIKRIRRYRISAIITKILIKLSLILIAVICFPISLTLHILGFRIASPFTSRIGHLDIEPDCIIKEIRLNNINLDPKKILLLSPKKICANRHLDSYWGNIFTVIRSPTLIWLLRGLSLFKVANLQTKKFIRNIGGSQSCFQIYSNWGDHMPILSLSTDDELYWNNLSRELGLPKNAWFVCAHARTGSYSEIDEPIQSYRNCNIANYALAIDEIIKRGGWVIRIGDKMMPALSQKEGVIDYSNSNLKSERMDVILCAKAKFILGCSSGIACLATVFGTPCAITNLVPISCLWFTSKDLSIPKSIFRAGDKKPLMISELLNNNSSNYQYTKLYTDNGLTVVENTKEEILDLTLDMFDKIEGEEESAKNQLQLRNNISQILKPHHYSFGSQALISIRYILNSVNRNSPLGKNLSQTITQASSKCPR